jgi:hypothetical protein
LPSPTTCCAASYCAHPLRLPHNAATALQTRSNQTADQNHPARPCRTTLTTGANLDTFSGSLDSGFALRAPRNDGENHAAPLI